MFKSKPQTMLIECSTTSCWSGRSAGMIKFWIILLILLNLVVLINAQKAEQFEADSDLREEGDQDELGSDLYQLDYLERYGYLPEKSKDPHLARGFPADALEDAIKLFQRQMGIEVNGKLDKTTREFMKKTRCGNKDYRTIQNNLDASTGGRYKRYALYPVKWQRTQLTYHISNYPTAYKNDKRAVNEVFKKAFKIWSDQVPLDFKKVKEKMDLEIKFVKDWHNCTVEMTARNGVLAHAFFPTENPSIARGIHFNDYLNWTLNAPSGTKGSLLATAIHEIGHTLGMEHSDVSSSKMAQPENWRQDLHPDDIEGIKSYYGDPSVLNSFYTIENKTIVADPRSAVYDKNALTIEQCAEYALTTGFNLTVWDAVEKKCHLKRTVEYEQVMMYTNSGKPIGHRDLEGYDFTVSVASEDYKNWALNRECDSVVKLERDFGRRTQHTAYLCKRYPETPCCTILYRIDSNIQLHSILEETIFRY